MATRIQDKVADGFASVDEAAENAVEDIRERVWELLTKPDERDPELWADMGAPTVSYRALESVAVPQRDLSWSVALATMVTAAQRQARIELLMQTVLDKAARHAAAVNALARTAGREAAIAAATEGISKADFNAAKARRQAVL